MSGSNTYILFVTGRRLLRRGGAMTCSTSKMLEHVTPVPNTAPAVDGVVFLPRTTDSRH